MFTLGGLMLLMWAIRFFVFRLLESPRYLVGQGQDEKAIEVLREVAKFNGKDCTLTVGDLQKAAGNDHAGSPELKTTTKVDSFVKVTKASWHHVKRLFATRKMAISTSLLIAQWGKFASLR